LARAHRLLAAADGCIQKRWTSGCGKRVNAATCVPEPFSDSDRRFLTRPAGKPIFTAHGKEDELAGFMALIQALVSVVRDTGDSLQTVR
jgi:hypothetical protein